MDNPLVLEPIEFDQTTRWCVCSLSLMKEEAMIRAMMKITLLCTLFGCLISCTGNPDEADGKKDGVPESFVKTYEGSLDNQYKVVMKITSNEGIVTGTYFYLSQGGNLKLQGELSVSNEILLNEFNDDGNQVGLFKGRLDGSKIEGTWSKPDGSKEMPFLLIESSTVYESLQEQVISSNAVNRLLKSGSYECYSGDSYANLVIEKLNEGRCHFSISVGSEYCTGELEGTVNISKSGKGTFSTDGCDALYFSFTKDGVYVRESECEYHGVRCSFEGFYR